MKKLLLFLLLFILSLSYINAEERVFEEETYNQDYDVFNIKYTITDTSNSKNINVHLDINNDTVESVTCTFYIYSYDEEGNELIKKEYLVNEMNEFNNEYNYNFIEGEEYTKYKNEISYYKVIKLCHYSEKNESIFSKENITLIAAFITTSVFFVVILICIFKVKETTTRKTITMKRFKEYINNNNFKILSETYDNNDYNILEYCLVESKDDYKVEFFTFETDEDTNAFYRYIYHEVFINDVLSFKASENKYSCTKSCNSESYFCVSRINNSILCIREIDSNNEKNKKIDEFLKLI